MCIKLHHSSQKQSPSSSPTDKNMVDQLSIRIHPCWNLVSSTNYKAAPFPDALQITWAASIKSAFFPDHIRFMNPDTNF